MRILSLDGLFYSKKYQLTTQEGTVYKKGEGLTKRWETTEKLQLESLQ